MKIVSFNIFDGGQARLPKILAIINKENPDYLAIQEANGFEAATILDYKNYALSLAPSGYHVATFSRIAFSSVQTYTGQFKNAALQTICDLPFGKTVICNTHLSPWTEDERQKELAIIIKSQEKYDYKIILGDLNSLSPHDSFPEKEVNNFNAYQRKKFMKNGKLCFDTINMLLNNGYVDVAQEKGFADIKTVHKSTQEKYAHSTMLRLDYIFISRSLLKFLKSARVIINSKTKKVSDHYPVEMVLI